MTETPPDWTGDELDSVAEGLQDASIPLQTTDPTEPLDDLEPLRDRLADATVVGMGEHSHGTREVFEFKHRLFRFLVEELDYRLFALESDFAATLAINDYVLKGEGTARDALFADGILEVWQCDAVLGLIEWIRSFNQGRPPDDRVRFYGLDTVDIVPNRLSSCLARIDPEGYGEIEDEIAYLRANTRGVGAEVEDIEEVAEAFHQIASTLEIQLSEYKAEYITRRSEQDFELAQRQVELLERSGEMAQAVASQDRETAGQIRTEVMSENVEWILDWELPENDRLAVWAHNNHVNRGIMGDGRWGAIPALGESLGQSDAFEYVSLGFSVADETVRIFSMDERTFEAVDRPKPPAGSVPDVLSRTEHGYAVVDLHTVSDGSPGANWLASEPGRGHLAARYQDEPVMYLETNPREEFDALVFIRQGSAAREIEGQTKHVD